jgi:predicted membrane-bound spermidine synthase
LRAHAGPDRHYNTGSTGNAKAARAENEPIHEQRASTRSALFLYGLIVFLSSAAVMILEIAAGRLIAPYVGVSLYSWTSIIGVVLAGLSLGNWVGGIWVDAGAGDREAGLALAASALATCGVVLMLTFVAPVVQSQPMGLMTASFLLSLGLFFLPAACLGLIAPMLTTLALRRDPRAGHVVGRMHALAALGSIAGTFAAGFVLIQYLGTRAVIVGAGVGLLALSLPLLRASKGVAAATILAALLVVGAGAARQGLATPCDEESQYYCIRVVDFGGAAALGDTRTLVLDHLIHGISHGPDGTLLFAPYAHLMDELIRRHLGERAASARYFFAGGGSYSQPRAVLSAFPAARVHVAELDPAVTRTAEEWLFVAGDALSVTHTDARLALAAAAPGTYDVVVGDVFHDVALPYHLTTEEYAALVRSRLGADGLYVLNVVDVFPDPQLAKSIMKTLAVHFRHVDAWLQSIPDGQGRVTYVISATDGQRPPAELESVHGFARTWFRVTEPLLKTGTPVNALPVLRDDFVPVERLVSRLLLGHAGE